MIIASKGHVRMKGNGVDILAEFITIAVDIAYLEKENPDNERSSN